MSERLQAGIGQLHDVAPPGELCKGLRLFDDLHLEFVGNVP